MLISATSLKRSHILGQNLFFLFGNDEGLIHYTRQKIAKAHDPSGEYTTVHDYKHVKGNGQAVINNAKAASLFGEKKVVIIEGLAGNISEKFLELFQPLPNAIYILQAASIKKTSKLFKYFNSKRNDVLTAQCYQLALPDIAKFAIEYMQKCNKQLNYDDAVFFASQLPSNVMLIERELEKLEIYAIDQTHITTDIIKSCTIADVALNVDEMFFQMMTNPKAALLLLENMLHNSENLADIIWLIRSMQNMTKRLIAMKMMLKQGESFESSMYQLKPPVFFKFHDKFSHLINISKLMQLKTMLENLNGLEFKVKLAAHNPLDLVGKYIINLSA